ncbi:hypothetical protein [Aliikangiella sp. G2MR2-5]|uniref:hypothetical protein n=1 Tax=Aliikangiella sp. G2MR2-5 TaxID=2788943 RepID=UPI0018ABCF1B|nr:hypothetical protein [Aliikangiella sp. G2MR2-5]
MSDMEIFSESTIAEMEEMFNTLDDYFSEHGERRRFMQACRKLSYEDVNIIQIVMNSPEEKLDISSLAEDVANPSRVANAILMLGETLRKTKDTCLLLFLLALVKKDKVAEALKRARVFSWEYELLENRKLPSEFVEYLWKSNRESSTKSFDGYLWSRMVAKNPNCPLSVLNELYKEDDSTLRGIIARHPRIDEDLINAFLNSSRVAEREQIAISKHVSQDVLLSLMRDKYEKVVKLAKRQFNKRFPDAKITDKDIDKAIEARIKQPYVKPKESKRKFDMYVDARMGVEHILTLKSGQRASVAKIADEKLIKELVADKSVAVRRVVASNLNCARKVLLEYLQESDLELRNNALLNLFQKDSQLIFEEIAPENMVSEFYEILNNYLNKNASLTSSMDAKTKCEIESASIVSQYSNNSMIQKRIINELIEIPSFTSVRRHLLSQLAKNFYLCESAIRKLALDLGFATEEILSNCTSQNLIKEYLMREQVPNGVRMRLENHLESLKK